ncbi:DUF1697 domain-containing protein [Sinomicrobium sp. M5D2P17]
MIKTYICMLRGINVSGKNIIKMADLKELFENLGFTGNTTYVQSGNIIFNDTSGADAVSLENLITEKIQTVFGHENITSFIKSKKELMFIRDTNPYYNPETDTKALYFTFIREKPEADRIAGLSAYKSSSESIHISDNCIYLYCPEGYGKTKLSNNLFENKLKLRATTRNWNTVNKLIEIADNTEKSC